MATDSTHYAIDTTSERRVVRFGVGQMVARSVRLARPGATRSAGLGLIAAARK